LTVFLSKKEIVLMNQGTNQGALAKGQAKKRCVSSSSRPHIDQRELIRVEYFKSSVPT
jgi:hypothetical protein